MWDQGLGMRDEGSASQVLPDAVYIWREKGGWCGVDELPAVAHGLVAPPRGGELEPQVVERVELRRVERDRALPADDRVALAPRGREHDAERRVGVRQRGVHFDRLARVHLRLLQPGAPRRLVARRQRLAQDDRRE